MSEYNNSALIVFENDGLDTERLFKNLERSNRNNRNNDISQILIRSNAYNSIGRTINELHTLINQMSGFKEDPLSSNITNIYVPNVMAHLMESRERAKRLYRDVLDAKFNDEIVWGEMEDIFDSLERELFRAEELLSLTPGRGSYH